MPFFAGEDPSVVMELAFCMERCCVGPDEDVIRINDVGHEMYFILEGTVEVMVMKKGLMTSIAKIKKEEFFGEMALLEPGHVRTANIRTVTFCEFRVLSSDAFNVISSRYPQFGKSLELIVRDRKSLRSSDFQIDVDDALMYEPNDLPPEVYADTAANNAANRSSVSARIRKSLSPTGNDQSDTKFNHSNNTQNQHISSNNDLGVKPAALIPGDRRDTANYFKKPSGSINESNLGMEETKDSEIHNSRTLQNMLPTQTHTQPHTQSHTQHKPVSLVPLELPSPSPSPGALAPLPGLSQTAPRTPTSINNPGPLIAPLKDVSSPFIRENARTAGGIDIEKQHNEDLTAIFNLIVSLKEQQNDFSSTILNRMNVNTLPSPFVCVCITHPVFALFY